MPAYGGSNVGWKHSAKFDWGKVSVEGGTPPPVGIYEAECVGVEVKLTQKGDPMISVKWKLTGAEEPECREEGVGKMIFDNLVMTQEGAFKAKQLAVVTGLELPESQAPDDVNAFADKITGMECSMMIRHRNYEGKPRGDILHYGAEPPTDETNGASKSKGGGKPAAAGRRR